MNYHSDETQEQFKKELLAQITALPERVQKQLWNELKEKGVIK